MMEKFKNWLLSSTKNKIIVCLCFVAVIIILVVLILCFSSKSNDKEIKKESKIPIKTETPKESEEPIVSTTPAAIHVHNIAYVSNNDGTHKVYCENQDGLECDYVETNENCTYENNVCSTCSYQNVAEEVENTPEPSEEIKQNSSVNSSSSNKKNDSSNNTNSNNANTANTTANNTAPTPTPEPQNNNLSNTQGSSPQETFNPRDLKTQCIDPVNRTMISLNELEQYPEGYVFYDDGNEKIIKEKGALITKINSISDDELEKAMDMYDRVMNLVNSNQDCLNWLEQHGGLKSVAESNNGPSVIANDGEIYYLY